MALSLQRGAAIKAALLVTASTYITYALSLAVGAIIARALAPVEYGKYAYVVWLVGSLVLIVNNGFNTSGIRFIAESLGRGSSEEARDVHGWLQRRQQATLILATLTFIAISWVMKPQVWLSALPLFICITAISLCCRATYLFDISIAKGYGAFHIEAYSTFGVSVVNILLVAILAVFGATLSDYLILFTITSAALWLYSSILLRRSRVSPSFRPLESELAGRIEKHLLWTVLLVASTAVGSKSIETFLLNHLYGPVEVGFFAIAVALTRGSTDILVVGLSTILMPAMGRAFGAGGASRVHTIFSEALSFFTFLGLLMAGAGALWSGAAITLMYGKQYSPVIPILQTMLIVGGLTLGEAAFGSLLSTTGRQSTWAKVSLLSLPLAGIFASILLPKFGLSGAAASYAVTKVIVFAVLAVAALRAQRIALNLRALSRIVMAALAATVLACLSLLFFSGTGGEILAGIVYVLAITAATVFMRAWNQPQLAMLLAMSDRLPPVLQRVRPLLQKWHDSYTNHS